MAGLAAQRTWLSSGWGARPWAAWGRASLATRFALAAGVVLAASALAIGLFVTARIEDAVVRNAANQTATYMESVIAPISQQLATQTELSPGARRALAEIFESTPLGKRVISYKFWRRDGTVIWAENQELVGQRFEPDEDLQRAWTGQVVASFGGLEEEENRAEAATGLPLLEIYSPIRAVWSGQVIAVAEFYEVAPELEYDLAGARRWAWAVVALTSLALGSILYAIVLQGSRTIEAQQGALDARVAELAEMSRRNTDLRLRVQAAAGRAAEAGDRAMRRIGADLHDGPAQDLAYAMLRLDALRDRLDGAAEAEAEGVAKALATAMAEVRTLSRGLQLPDIAARSLREVVATAVEAHEVRTGHAVEVRLEVDPGHDPGAAAKVCVFRFLQEGLANATRHAGGIGLEVEVTARPGSLAARLLDGGPGLPVTPTRPDAGHGLGLGGLRDRVESLGGTFTARTRPEGGTELVMTLEA